MVPAGLQHRRLHLRWHLMRIHPRGRCERSANCSRPPASYLASQACSVCRDTPTAAATSLTVRPSLITASPARYRCSATLISLIRECQGSTELSTISRNHVKHQPKAKSQASAEGIHFLESWRGDSNPQPPVYKTGALPIAPRQRQPLRLAEAGGADEDRAGPANADGISGGDQGRLSAVQTQGSSGRFHLHGAL